MTATTTRSLGTCTQPTSMVVRGVVLPCTRRAVLVLGEGVPGATVQRYCGWHHPKVMRAREERKQRRQAELLAVRREKDGARRKTRAALESVVLTLRVAVVRGKGLDAHEPLAAAIEAWRQAEIDVGLGSLWPKEVT